MAAKETAPAPNPAEADAAPASSKPVIVRPRVHIEHNGKVYEPGGKATFEVSAAQLQALRDVQAVDIV
jgi:hypothetical protein